MADIQLPRTCPGCGEPVDPSVDACPACGQELGRRRSGPPGRRRPDDELEDYDDVPRRRPRDIVKDPNEEALSWIVPMRESLWAIAAGYLGLFACFPFLGFVAAPLAIALGIVALKDIKRNPGRRGAFRAWFGIVLGGFMAVAWFGLLLVMLLNH
jgi:hypothetical protein